eukprot:gene11059-11142_t
MCRKALISRILNLLVVALSLFLGVTASFALARVRFRGRGFILMVILGISMFPQIAVLAGLFELVRFFHIFNTIWALIFSYTIFTLPFTVWVLTTFMRDLPIEVEEAAIVDGATPWVIITRVFLPLMWPAMVTTGLLGFIGAWNEFLFALTFTSSNTTRTVPVAIALLSGASEHEIPWGLIMAASVIVTVPLVVLVLIFQRKIISGLTAVHRMAAIQLRNLRKTFGAVHVIKGVDLEIKSGEFMVFVGPSGCGKSTLLRLIAGLEDITSGELVFDGQGVWSGSVVHTENLGADSFVYVNIGLEEPLTVRVIGTAFYAPGTHLNLSPYDGYAHRFDADGKPVVA